MTDKQYKGPVCRGSWVLGNNCKICERCVATKPTTTEPRDAEAIAKIDAALKEAGRG